MVMRTTQNGLVLAGENETQAFLESGWESADKKESHGVSLPSLYCYLIGYGDCSVRMGKENGNGHLINSFSRRRQQ